MTHFYNTNYSSAILSAIISAISLDCFSMFFIHLVVGCIHHIHSTCWNYCKGFIALHPLKTYPNPPSNFVCSHSHCGWLSLLWFYLLPHVPLGNHVALPWCNRYVATASAVTVSTILNDLDHATLVTSVHSGAGGTCPYYKPRLLSGKQLALVISCLVKLEHYSISNLCATTTTDNQQEPQQHL